MECIFNHKPQGIYLPTRNPDVHDSAAYGSYFNSLFVLSVLSWLTTLAKGGCGKLAYAVVS